MGGRKHGLSSGGREHSFKGIRRNPIQSGVGADGIVEEFQIGEHIALRSRSSWIEPEMDQLAFETDEEVFRDRVVVRIASARYTLAKAVGIQTFSTGHGGILQTSVAVENEPLRRYAMSKAASVSCVSIRSEKV